jgi:hypothetical protein
MAFVLDTSKAEKTFKGFKYTTLEDTLRDSLVYFKEKGFVA